MKLRPSIHGFYAKNYLFATLLSIIMFFAGVYMIIFSPEIMISIGLLLLSVFLIVVGVVHSVVNSKTSMIYIENDEQLVYETGILSHHKKVAAVSRITDTAIKRSFFERIIGVADLQINTAGTADVEIMANDFNYTEINELHDRLNRLIHRVPVNRATEPVDDEKK